jgi:hypothetical protein
MFKELWGFTTGENDFPTGKVVVAALAVMGYFLWKKRRMGSGRYRSNRLF